MPLDRTNGLLEPRTSGFEPKSPHKGTVVVLSRTLPVELRVPCGTPVGLEPTTPGLAVLDILLLDHLKRTSVKNKKHGRTGLATLRRGGGSSTFRWLASLLSPNYATRRKKPPNALDMTLDSIMRELALVQAVLPTRGVAHINRYLG